MLVVQTTAEVLYTCYLSDEDEELVNEYVAENDCDLEDAVRALYYTNKINLYADSRESDFNTQTIDDVWEE